jgi:hypothetical protein
MVLGITEGAIELKLESNLFEPGKPIKGKIILHLNKNVKARQLRVQFYGLLRKDPKSGELTRVHETTQVVCGEAVYTDEMEFGFQITPPEDINKRKTGIFGLFSFGTPQVETRPRFWVVQATLDVPMATDLNKQVEVMLKPQ